MSESSRCVDCGRYHASTVSCPDRAARVLVVEDSAAVLRVLVKTLEQAGYDVLAASNGAEALRKTKVEGPLDLLITDMVMPGPLQGESLIAELRRVQKDLPVIVITGYATDVAIRGFGVPKDALRLMKPVPRKVLRSAVQKILWA